MRSILLLSAIISSFLIAPQAVQAGAKQDFWNRQRAGANCFNREVTSDWLKAAKERHIQFIRLTPSKWKSAGRDFLIGNADRYDGIPEEDFAKLVQVLDLAQEQGIKVIVTPLSLPGARWLQQNGDKPDHRLWQDESFQRQAAMFWHDLAVALKDHPAVVGYNIINEPAPERATKPRLNDSLTEAFSRWYEQHAHGTAADLNAFYARIISAIRAVDKETPIVLDSGQYATVNAFDYLEPYKSDPGILYSFHQYEPAAYTNIKENGGRFSYPCVVSSEGDTRMWNAEAILQYVDRVREWAKKNKIPPNRILAGEFGVNRVIPGASQYLADNIGAFNENGWHWAFYSFREDTWEGMDYELGVRKLPQEYFDSKGKGESTEVARGDNPVFEPIKKGLDLVWSKSRPVRAQ